MSLFSSSTLWSGHGIFFLPEDSTSPTSPVISSSADISTAFGSPVSSPRRSSNNNHSNRKKEAKTSQALEIISVQEDSTSPLAEFDRDPPAVLSSAPTTPHAEKEAEAEAEAEVKAEAIAEEEEEEDRRSNNNQNDRAGALSPSGRSKGLGEIVEEVLRDHKHPTDSPTTTMTTTATTKEDERTSNSNATAMTNNNKNNNNHGARGSSPSEIEEGRGRRRGLGEIVQEVLRDHKYPLGVSTQATAVKAAETQTGMRIRRPGVAREANNKLEMTRGQARGGSSRGHHLDWGPEDMVTPEPVLLSSQPRAGVLQLESKFSVPLPPNAAFNLMTDPELSTAFHRLREVRRRCVVEDDGHGQQRVQVEQANHWRYLTFSGTFTTDLIVTQHRPSHSVVFELAETGSMKEYSGEWHIKPILASEADWFPGSRTALLRSFHKSGRLQLGGGSARAVAERKERDPAVGAWISFLQVVEPSASQPWPLSFILPKAIRTHVQSLLTLVQLEALHLAIVLRWGGAPPTILRSLRISSPTSRTPTPRKSKASSASLKSEPTSPIAHADASTTLMDVAHNKVCVMKKGSPGFSPPPLRFLSKGDCFQHMGCRKKGPDAPLAVLQPTHSRFKVGSSPRARSCSRTTATKSVAIRHGPPAERLREEEEEREREEEEGGRGGERGGKCHASAEGSHAGVLDSRGGGDRPRGGVQWWPKVEGEDVR